MSDQFDQAQRLEEFYRARAIEAATGPMRCEIGPEPDGICIDCADPIDPERLAVRPRARLCVFCQEARERRERAA